MGSTSTKSAADTSQANNGGGYVRRAHHAGSWYSDNADELRTQLQGFLRQVKPHDETTATRSSCLRAVICPHAGYSYAGPTAAWSYDAVQRALQQSPPSCVITTMLVLHPSHHESLAGCAVSGAREIVTPLGSLAVDDGLRQEILQMSRKFTVMNQQVDEHEHSGEMQYPYLAMMIAAAQGRKAITVLPVMCGALSRSAEIEFGQCLSDIIARPNILTVVSTDFCHWGQRFQYQPTDETNQGRPIHEYIAALDREGMTLIERQQPGGFADYLQRTRNTICGRHAIAVWMRAVEFASAKNTDAKLQVQFVQYNQSSPATSRHDSSVSYAAAVAYAT